MNGKIKNIKKTIIIALIIALVPAQAQAWTFSGAYQASKSYISNNVKAVAAAVAGVVAIATSAILWKRISDRNARIAAQAKLRAEQEAQEQAELAQREFEHVQELAIEPLYVEVGQQRVPEAQVLRAVASDNVAQLQRSVSPEGAPQLARINNDVEYSFMRNYEQLRQMAMQRLDELATEKSEIEAHVARISNRITLDEIKQLETRSKAIKQEAATIADIFDKNYMIKLDQLYTQNFRAHNIDPTQAYQLLDIQPSASQAPTPAYIKSKRDECLAQAQGDEGRLWQVRQAGWVFGYPNCNQLAQQAYDLYLLWHRAGKPASFDEKINEYFDQDLFNKAGTFNWNVVDLGLRLAELQDAVVRRQRQEEKDAQEYEYLGFSSLAELLKAYDQFNVISTIKLNRIAQNSAYNRADLILFREYRHELEMMQQGTVLLRENPECQAEAQRLQLNTLFFEITRKIHGLEKLIALWSSKLEEPLRKAKSDIALEKAQGMLAGVADYWSQAGEAVSSARQTIKNKAREMLP